MCLKLCPARGMAERIRVLICLSMDCTSSLVKHFIRLVIQRRRILEWWILVCIWQIPGVLVAGAKSWLVVAAVSVMRRLHQDLHSLFLNGHLQRLFQHQCSNFRCSRHGTTLRQRLNRWTITHLLMRKRNDTPLWRDTKYRSSLCRACR